MNQSVRSVTNENVLQKLLQLSKKPRQQPLNPESISFNPMGVVAQNEINELKNFKEVMIAAYNSLKNSYQITLNKLNKDNSVIATDFADASISIED